MSEDSIDFTLIKQIPPAFAGLLVDSKVGANAITATIIDLVLRGYIEVVGEKLYLINKKDDLLSFEKKLLDCIFAGGDSENINAVHNKVFGDEFDAILKEICKDFVNANLVVRDLDKRMAELAKKILKKTFGPQVDYQIPENAKISNMPPTKARLFVKMLFPAVYRQLETATESVAGKISISDYLTDKGKQFEELAARVKSFIVSNPLIEDRLANELVEYAIVFDIGKVWLKKLAGKKSKALILAEKLTPPGEVLSKFIDFDSYLKEFKHW